MSLRLLEMVLPEEHQEEVEELIREKPLVGIWYDHISDKQIMLKILATSEDIEHIMDLLNERFVKEPWFRLVLLSVVASLPRVEESVKEEGADGESGDDKKKKERISREELYGAVTDMVRLTRVYVGMVVLSTVVAAVGLLTNDSVVIIGAMVIAPLLGPILAQAMGTTLGDGGLVRSALKTNLVGLGLALGLSVLLGLVLEVNPAGKELSARTSIELGDIVVALASGGAGTLAFTAGVSTVLVGVMVAVALLPPLASLGLFLGSGYLIPALGAGLLLITNIICINLAGVMVFWAQGVRPTSWWEEDKAQRATMISIAVCALLLLILALSIIVSKHIYSFDFL
jgi:uncharacterized hydrophobic protein (TIGR00341 family)